LSIGFKLIFFYLDKAFYGELSIKGRLRVSRAKGLSTPAFLGHRTPDFRTLCLSVSKATFIVGIQPRPDKKKLAEEGVAFFRSPSSFWEVHFFLCGGIFCGTIFTQSSLP